MWPLKKIGEQVDYVMGVFGFDDLFDYLESIGASKEIRADVLRKIREQHKNQHP